MFVYFLLFFSLVFSTPLPLISTRDVTKRRERKMRLLFCGGKNFNGAKVVLATTTTTRKTTNLFSRRCFCSSARCCSPCLSFGKKKIISNVPQIRGCLLRVSSSDEPSKDKNNSNNSNNTNAWELFYQNHRSNFFRDRHYLRKSFKRDLMNDVEFEGFVENVSPEELKEKMKTLPALDVLEIGVGVGNAMFPLLRANPNLRFQCADVSETAIEQLKLHVDYDERRISKAFVVDAGERGCLVSIKDESFDVVLMCFFLSALNDAEIRNCLMEIRRVLRNGGVALVRDYADDDEKNKASSDFNPGRKVVMEDEREAYRRSDGTLARFFSERQMMEMFTGVGFQEAASGEEDGVGEEREERKKGSAVERVLFTQANRKMNVEITRAFLEGRFVK